MRAKHDKKLVVIVEIKSFESKHLHPEQDLLRRVNPTHPWILLTQSHQAPGAGHQGKIIQASLVTTARDPRKLTPVQPSWMATLCVAKGNQDHLQ